MPVAELFTSDQAATTVSAGGTTAPAGGTTETWTVTSSAGFGTAVTGVSQYHVADPALPSEIIAVTNVSGTTWTVTRGAEGTTPAAHAAGFTAQQVAGYAYLASAVQVSGTPAAGQVPAAAGTGNTATWAYAPVDWLNVVTAYGADPAGVADSTTAIGSAITAAASSGQPVYFPAGTYKITAALNWKITGLTVIGAGSGTTTISQATANTPILQVAGSYQDISGLTLTWPSQQTSGQTSSIAVEFGDDTAGSCFQSWFHDLQIQHASTGLAISPAITTVAGMFSCLLQDIAIGNYSYSAINLVGGNGAGANCTGCVFTNIYTQDGSATPAYWPVFLEYWDEVTFHQVNIEHVTLASTDGLALVNVGNAVLAGVHFEEVTQTADQRGLIYVSASSAASRLTAYGVTNRFGSFSGATQNSVFRCNGTNGASIVVDGFLEDSSNTVTTPARYAIDFNSATGVTAYFRSFDTGQVTAQQANASTGDVVSQYNASSTHAGTSSLAPLNLAAGTLLGTAAAGAVEYDGTAWYATAAASSRQVVAADQFQCLSSAYTLTNGTSAQKLFNATSNGALTVQGSTTYFFECSIYVTGLSSSSHTISFGFGGTATFTSVLWNSYAGLSGAGSTTSAAGTSASATAITATTSGTVLQALIKGVLRINAGGTVIPQITQNTASAAASVNAGSYIRLSPAGSGSVTNVGDWS